MKSEATEIAQKSLYPAFYKLTNGGDIVLFTDKTTGTVVSPGVWPLGFYSETWVDCHDKLRWNPWFGEVKIST
jgi:hypothetical protein